MSGFLIDENLPPLIGQQIQRHEPAIPVLSIGLPGAPSKGTPDPQILIWMQANDYLLVTNNRTSMPGHLRDHIADGQHIPGILITPFPLDIGALVEELILIWGAGLPNEFQDRIVYLSFGR